MIGLDTTAIIDLFKGKPEIKGVMQKQSSFAVTDLNYLELLFGLDMAKGQHVREAEYYEQFFESVVKLSFNRLAAQKASEIYWKLKKEGKIIGKFDCIIAAIYLNNNVHSIITRNIEHFSLAGMDVVGY
ncbi:MAG TPA: type II toxin-antitoxin system VapC family toxin [Candidatus Nanoarchaeia archaeon]|nr:type II toxin-antitoxin system VapC family toxin [Candidatus Nanoarchaeia archaeon]